MIKNIETMKAFLDEANIENATIKEIMVADIMRIFSHRVESLYKPIHEYVNEYPFEEYEEIIKRDDNIVKIIFGFNILLERRGKWYLENKWGINVKELTKEILEFEQDLNFLEKDSIELEEFFRNNFTFNDDISDEPEETHIPFIYSFNELAWALEDKFNVASSYISHVKKYNELKLKIYNAATKELKEYRTELRLFSLFSKIEDKLTFNDFIKFVMSISKIPEKKDYTLTNIIIEKYEDLLQKKTFTTTIPSPKISKTGNIGLGAFLMTEHKSNLLKFLCTNNKKYIYYFNHFLLYFNLNNYKENYEQCDVGRLLHEGYIKWCEKYDIPKLVKLPKSQLIDYSFCLSKNLKGKYHLPKKRFFYDPNNENRVKLNKYFLEELYKGMIEEKIIAHNTELASFIFVFGYWGDKIDNFCPIKILKPETNYARENGKRTILYLLRKLMNYSDNEIRPSIKGNKHLLLNSCFSSEYKFKSSDFGENIKYKGSEIEKIEQIYNAALNNTKAHIFQETL